MDLQVVQDVRRNTVQATCLQEQTTGETGQVPPSKCLQGRVHHIELPFGSKVTRRTGVLLREQETGKLWAVPRGHRNPKGGCYRLRDKEENCAESECKCLPPVLTERDLLR